MSEGEGVMEKMRGLNIGESTPPTRCPELHFIICEVFHSEAFQNATHKVLSIV